MTASTDNLTPQQRLANIVAEVTDDGRRVVQFFMQVANGELDGEGFQPNHRMDAAKELVKIGLTQFKDYIEADAAPPKPRKPRRKAADPGDISPEVLQAREELANYARELTGDGRSVIRMYSEIMDGFRNDEGFKPHHRIAAGRELLLRGFGPVSAWTQPGPAEEPRPQPEPRPESQFQTLPEPMLDYIEEALRAYRGPNPMEEIFSPELMDVIRSDDPVECPCSIAEREGRDIPCPENEDECPYYGLEFPKLTKEESARIEEWAADGLRIRFEMMGYASPSEEDP